MEIAYTLPMSEKEKQNLITQTVTDYSSRLFSFIRPKVKNAEDAEDILQDVWYQFSNLANITDIANVGSWLYRVTTNKITDRYRKKKTSNLEDYVFQHDDGEFGLKDILLMDTSKDPELSYFQDEIWKAFLLAIQQLPEKQQLVFMENEIDGKTLQQIANEQNENIKTIISRKQYAVKHLRKKLQHLYKDLSI